MGRIGGEASYLELLRGGISREEVEYNVRGEERWSRGGDIISASEGDSVWTVRGGGRTGGGV